MHRWVLGDVYCTYHRVLEWPHHISLVCLPMFASSKITWVKHPVAAIYYASVVDKDTTSFFLLDQVTRQSPK
jgi:hypothetical protein